MFIRTKNNRTPASLGAPWSIQSALCLLVMTALLACSQEPPPTESPTADSAAYREEQTTTDGKTYYIAVDGSDRNSGLNEFAPWKTISKVNATFFEPGDRVCFRRGDTWREQLTVSSPGALNRNIHFEAYGSGANPRLAGTVPTIPHRNAFRNPSFEEFNGVADDDLTDDFLHFFNAGGRVEAVSDTFAGGGDVAMHLAGEGSSAGAYATVFLPADTRVKMRWRAKAILSDGGVTIRHWLKGSTAHYLQDNRQTWDAQVNWDAFPIAGSSDGAWEQQSIEFNSDDVAGAYQVYFLAANAAVGNTGIWLDAVELNFEWESAFDHTCGIGTGYEPKRLLMQTGENWAVALNGKDFGRTPHTLDDHMWIYDPTSGMLYFRDDAGCPPDSGILPEISVPEAGAEGECGIYIDQAHITVADLSVVGWPDDNPAFDHAGGIVITENGEGITITGTEIAFNYRVGLMSLGSDGTFNHNLFAYNGGNGFSLVGPAQNNRIAHNEAKYNGYWGTTGDDGEGIAMGSGTASNLVEWNEIHHNNRHPQSWNPGGLALYHSNDNIVRYNLIYLNYKAGAVIDGAGNRFYYNLVYGNGIGYAETGAHYMCNVMVRDYSPDGPGGNKVFNNIFFGGTSDTRWMGNLFINRQCTDTEIRNNIFWGFSNAGYNDVQIRVDGGLILTGTVFSNNVIGPEGPGFIHFSGVNYATLSAYQAGTGQGAGSLSSAPEFIDPENADFHLSAYSVLIDAGADVGLPRDLDLNPVDMLPDIGAFEYHPH